MSQSTKSTKSVVKSVVAPIVMTVDNDEPNDVDVVLARSAAIRAARGV
jgi:hypothetical protein